MSIDFPLGVPVPAALYYFHSCVTLSSVIALVSYFILLLKENIRICKVEKAGLLPMYNMINTIVWKSSSNK